MQGSKKTEISPVHKYYSITGKSNRLYVECLEKFSPYKKVLELGCGKMAYAAFDTVKMGASSVIGIDFSSVEVKKAKDKAIVKNVKNVFFIQGNVEEMPFKDNSFDFICGTGILHHIDIDKAYSEIARILNSDGRAVFKEPMGHNILINLYRRFTPHIRKQDEHPLKEKDLRKAWLYFRKVETHFFHLLSLLAVPFRKFPFFKNIILPSLDWMDEKLFNKFPSMKKYAWFVVIILGQPKSQ